MPAQFITHHGAKRRHNRNSESGALLVLSVVALFLIASLSIGILAVTSNAIRTSNQQLRRASALNLAESGAERAALWLKDQAYPPTDTDDFDPLGGTQYMAGGSYSVRVHPDPDNATSYLKTYEIISTGVADGQTKTVEVVVKQSSFGRYAYFTDRETSSVSGGEIWWKAGESVDGPVHSNNSNGSNFNINYNGSSSPIFLDMVTASGNSIDYSPSKPRNESTYKKIFLNGSKGFKLGVPRVDLPPSTDAQKEAAWGGTGGFPSSDGVYLRENCAGGIYVRGNCTMELSVDGSGNQVITIVQGSWWSTKTTVITLDKTTQTTSVSGPVGSGSSTGGSGLPNGVIYCTGNITSLSGTVADNRVVGDEILVRSEMTIATDVNAGKDITITDNLVYDTKPDKTLDADDPVNLAAGTLGLVAESVIISSSAPSNLEIDAVTMAGSRNTSAGSFYVQNYSSKRPAGTLSVLGGIIQKARGPVGTFNSSTGQTTTGYAKNYKYDPRLAQNPPPFYPTTGQYERLSWRVLPN